MSEETRTMQTADTTPARAPEAVSYTHLDVYKRQKKRNGNRRPPMP